MPQGRYVFPFSQLRMTDVDRVGGKNASLGELLSQLTSAGIRVPDGFATTAEAFRLFLTENNTHIINFRSYFQWHHFLHFLSEKLLLYLLYKQITAK